MGTSRTLEGDTMILRHYKAPRHDPRRDSSYLRWLRILPCIVCCQWNLPTNRQSGPVEAAHVGERGIGQKCAALVEWSERKPIVPDAPVKITKEAA